MIRKNLIKSLSVIMAAMMAIMTVACGQNTVETSETAAVTMETEQEQTDALADTMVSASNIASAESSADKVETVYVTADANGAVNDVIVSEWLKNAASSAALDDTTGLKNIVNVKGSETFKDNGDGTLTWDAEGSDIYYQGTTDKQLPVTMKITYTLDGKEISPEELAGKSGKVTIRFEYENNSKQTVEVNGKDVEVYTPFAMVSGMMLDADKFANVEISNGKVISDGGKTIVMGVALPGLKESLDISEDKWDKLEDADDIKERLSNSFEITADTTDFELGMTITMASSDILSDFGMTDLSGSDKLTDLKDDMEELNDGSNKLVDGAGKLKDGTTDLTDGTKKLYDGAVELKDGTQKLYDGTVTLRDGTGTLASGAGTLSDGINKYTDGVSKVNDGAGQLASGAAELHKGTSAFVKGIEAAGLVSSGNGQQSNSSEGVQQIATGLANLQTSLNSAEKKLEYQRTAYGAIYQWLNAKGTATLSNPLTAEQGGDELFNQCLKDVSDDQLTSVAVANGWMSQYSHYNDILTEVYGNASSTPGAGNQTTQTIVSDPQYSYLFDGLDTDGTDEDKEVPVSETTETPVTADDDNIVTVKTDTLTNPNENDDDTREDVTEPEVNHDNDDDESGDGNGDDENKNNETAEKKDNPDAGTVKEKSEVSSEVTESTDDDDDDEELNSTKTMVVTRTILKTTYQPLTTASANDVNAAKTFMNSYNQMLGSSKALYGATDKSVQMFTASANPQTPTLLQAVAALNKGFGQLVQKLGGLTSGLGTIYETAVKIDNGAAKLSGGASDLADGTKELASNNDALRDGAEKLADGAGELFDGAGKLRDGAGELNDGAGDLLDGTKELYDGSIELDNGVKELLDGVTKFDEEGIKKIYEAFDGDLSDFTDRLEAIKEAGSSYKTFGGSADDVDSSVKFIIKTDSIKSL
ncbi:MAG: hypothetical protein J6I68_13050 [Butyrivibrio sp.]|uniref:hypothetical protein n=1 Tax=Butyrivibrio sp. TaxID=28121 RepID=UPI001B66513F|nr:hypothetical protein [Butyrivibrio sp.]MBP3784166.1 hypothetical protein [Butyrivibrio sp.]